MGADPAFVLMHGFPDNLDIYDDLIPHLVASERRVVTFDLLGFGARPGSAGDNRPRELAEHVDVRAAKRDEQLSANFN